MAAPHNVPTANRTEALQALRSELPSDLQSSLYRASDLIRLRRAVMRQDPLSTSISSLDRILGTGLPRGELVEIVGRGSCGRFASLLAALRAVTGAGEVAALVDQGAQLDPQTAVEIGVDLERLLWLRPQNLNDSLAAAELLLRTGFPLVALDLGLPPVRGRAPLAAWLRLARGAATHGAVVLVGSPYRLSGCAAGAVITSGRGRGDWSGGGRVARLLNGLQSRFFLSKRIGHPDLGEAAVVLTLPEAAFGQATPDTLNIDRKSEIRNPKSEIPTEGREHHVAAI